MVFLFFLNFFFDKELPTSYLIVPSTSKFVKTWRVKRNSRQQLWESNFPRFCWDGKIYTFVVVCPTLHHCRLCFFGNGISQNLIFAFRQPKMKVDGIYYVPQSYYCQKIWTSHFNVMSSMSILSPISVHLNALSLSDKIRACFSIQWPYYGTVYDLHGIILHYGFFMTCMLP